MMTLEKMMAIIEGLGEDAYVWERNGMLHVTLNDDEGIDDDGEEVSREYDNPEAVERFEEMLETECLAQEGDFYTIYHFEGFDVMLGYTSFDI